MLEFRTHRDVGYSTVRSARFAPPCLARSLSPYPRLLPFTGRPRTPSLFILLQEGAPGGLPPSLDRCRRVAVSHCRLSLLFHIASGATSPCHALRKHRPREIEGVPPECRKCHIPIFTEIKGPRYRSVSVTLISGHLMARKSLRKERPRYVNFTMPVRKLK